MENKDKKEKEDGKSKKSHKNSLKVPEDTKIFFISCFHKDLLDENLFNSLQVEIENIQFQYSFKLEALPNHIPKVYLINFKKNQKRPKYLNLSVNFGSTAFQLNQLSLSDKKRFIFGDIKISDKNINDCINYINNKLKINSIMKNNFCFLLDYEQKLNIFINCIDKIYNENEKKLTEYSDNLAYDFLNVCKNDINKFNFSTAINIFTLSYKNKNLFQFLDIMPKISYNKDNFSNNYFLELLNCFNNNNNSFFEPITKYKYKDKHEHYKKLMNDFIYIFLLLYEKEKIINDKTMCLNSENSLMKLINDKYSFVEATKFIQDYLELMYIIYIEKEKNAKNKNDKDKNSDKKEKSLKFRIKNDKNINAINFENFDNFKNDYIVLVNYQKNKNKYFLDFTYIIEKLINANKNNLMNLKKIFETFKFELAQKSNFPQRDNLNKVIDKLGKELFRKGQLKNESILDFISFNEIYC